VPDQDLLNDIKAFVTKGAKDGDSPRAAAETGGHGVMRC
jgi:hypothetical protein